MNYVKHNINQFPMATDVLVSPDKVCRICLSKSPNLKSLLTNISSNKTLLEALCLIVNTDISIKNHFPDRICADCESIICKTEDFKRRCIESETILEQQAVINEINRFVKKHTRKSKVKLEKLGIEDEEVGVVPFMCSDCFSMHPTLLSFTKHKRNCNGISNEQHDLYENDINTGIVKQEIKVSYDSNIHDDLLEECKSLCDVENEFSDHDNEFHNQNEILEPENTINIKRVNKFKEKKKYECSICIRSYRNKNSLVLHLKTHGDCKKHVCDKCDKEFSYEAHLKNHIINLHKHEKTYTCEYCIERFDSLGSLNSHKIKHNVKKKSKCKICEKSFLMLSTLTDHMRTHTGEKPFLCSICGKGFSQKTNLAQHMRRHQGLKPFKCNICERSFVSKGELEAHSRSHSGLHPFVCATCGGAFTTSSALVKHRRTHTGERPYRCDLCPAAFAASGTLANHRRTHTNERPYHCSHCDKAFVQRTDLVSHIRCHTGEKPYVCTVCGHSFRKAAGLKTHVRNCHGKDQGAGMQGVTLIGMTMPPQVS